MTNNIKQFECEQLAKIAQEYKDKGYSVLVNPSSSDLPSFLASASFQPDLLAKNSEENIIVEVKTQSSLRANLSEIQQLSQTIQSQPGWHFVLALRDLPRVELVLSEREPLTTQQMLKKISVVEKLLGSRHSLDDSDVKEALTLIWPTVETVLQQIAARNQITLQENRIAYLLENLTYLGLIEQDDFRVLWGTSELRRAITQNGSLDNHYVQELKQLPHTLRRLTAKQEMVAVVS